jgi:hypothetical protein
MVVSWICFSFSVLHNLLIAIFVAKFVIGIISLLLEQTVLQ